jgi:hypothetical protein
MDSIHTCGIGKVVKIGNIEVREIVGLDKGSI